jgi:hypothetical protein
VLRNDRLSTLARLGPGVDGNWNCRGLTHLIPLAPNQDALKDSDLEISLARVEIFFNDLLDLDSLSQSNLASESSLLINQRWWFNVERCGSLRRIAPHRLSGPPRVG